MPSAEDGSLRIRGRDVLDVRVDPPDCQAATIREYLCELIKVAWHEKRAFGTSGWHSDLYEPLVKLGMVSGTLDEDGFLAQVDEPAAMRLLWEAIDVLAAEPFKNIGMKTASERHLAKLQRRHSGKR